MASPVRPAIQFNTAPCINPSEHRVRLFWSIQGPLEDSVMVMRGKYNPEPPLEKYYESPSADSPDSGWHPISQEPVTEPPVQTLKVEIMQFQEWDYRWEDIHMEDLDNRLFQDKDGNQTVEEEDEEGNPNKLIRCCGHDRPPDNVVCEVRASGKDKDYVTVHDYLTTLHKWLRTRRNDILLAMSPESEYTEPLPNDTQLVVANYSVDLLIIDQIEDWKSTLRARSGTDV
ncbi:hypothetical protein LIA77_05504 [Sarocladium implicatum]|nr:hypothetical protein LIA77_05504 [Sarocladium implicatum]